MLSTFGMTLHVTGLVAILYSGTSLLLSPMELGKSDLNGEVSILQRANILCFGLWNSLESTKGDRNVEFTLLVR